MRSTGIEPVPIAWKATMLTITPRTLVTVHSTSSQHFFRLYPLPLHTANGKPVPSLPNRESRRFVQSSQKLDEKVNQ